MDVSSSARCQFVVLRAAGGGVATRPLPLRNAGGAPLEVSLEVVGRPDVFTVAPPRLHVPPDHELTAFISYRPAAGERAPCDR